ncbi:MAG: SDR family oxidoreductase [Henriciella sp.]|nr:SDR family oxidoreductase [Henriciella sp.]
MRYSKTGLAIVVFRDLLMLQSIGQDTKKMPERLQGKVAIVTGASRGLGRQIAETFIGEGARVSLIDLKQKWVEAVAEELDADGQSCLGLAADVSDREAITRAIDMTAEKFGQVTTLVNNAMWNRYEPIKDIEQDTFDRMIGVGLGGIVWGIQAASKHMAAQGGSIINIGSMAGRLGSPNALLYAGVKSGVDGLTRAASVELGHLGIRVNAIAPSTVTTEGVKAILTEELIAKRLGRTPLGRLGAPTDIADAALWLASDESAFVTGQSIAVDGGLGHALM